MSVALELYPEILNPGRNLYLEVFNPTNASQDVTLTFYSDSTPILQIVLSGVPPGRAVNFVSSWADLGLDPYKGKVVSVLPSIPTPEPGVYLLGTTVAPSTKGNAKVLSIGSSTVTVRFLDPDGKPVANAHVALLDLCNGKTYSYLTDSDGKVYLPDRPTAYYGMWLIELYEPKPELGYVLYALENYDYTSKDITCKRFRSGYVEIALHMPKDSYAEAVVKGIHAYMPEPLKSVVSLIAQGLGWLHDTVLNFVFSFAGWMFSFKSGHGITSVKWESDELKVTFNVGLTSPFAWGPIAEFLSWLFKWIIGFFVAYIITRVVDAWTSTRIAEETTKQTEQKSATISELNKLLEEGKIDKDTYSKALDTINDVYRSQTTSTPTFMGIPIETIVALVTLVCVVIIITSLVSAFKR
jgi:uncharacterized membrane protein